jgi:hypothetical protein
MVREWFLTFAWAKPTGSAHRFGNPAVPLLQNRAKSHFALQKISSDRHNQARMQG